MLFTIYLIISHFSSCHIDIDECITNNGGCSQICANEVGSYKCLCYPGFVLETDEHLCIGM